MALRLYVSEHLVVVSLTIWLWFCSHRKGELVITVTDTSSAITRLCYGRVVLGRLLMTPLGETESRRSARVHYLRRPALLARPRRDLIEMAFECGDHFLRAFRA